MKPLLLLFSITLLSSNLISAQPDVIKEDEVLKLATKIEYGMNNNDVSVLTSFFDKAALIRKIKMQSKEATKSKDFIDGFSSTFNMSSFGKQTMENEEGGSYKLLRTFKTNNTWHVLFRVFGKGGIGYQDFSLIKVNNTLKADDVFTFVSGEWLSSTIAHFVDESMAGQSPEAIVDDMKALQKLKALIKENQLNDVIKIFNTLDDRYRNSKTIQLLYIQACHRLDNQLYKSALENFAKTFPDAPNVYLLMLDAYYLNKEYDKALASVDMIDSLAHGDPFLDYYRANLYYASGNATQAKADYKKVLEYDPLIYPKIIQSLVAMYMKDNEENEARSAIQTYLNTTGSNKEYVDDLYDTYPSLKKKRINRCCTN